MSAVTVNIDHIPTEPITDEKWVDIAVSLLHEDEHAIHTRREDVASLLAENARLSKELDSLEDARFAESDHLTAKYWRRMQETRAALNNTKEN